MDANAASNATDRDATDATVCPLCAVGCRLAPGEGAGRARGVPGPANPNGRLCAKGASAFESVGDDERLTSPLVREGGELVETNWESALARAVDGLGSVRDAHGADALAFLGAPHCSNEENYLLQKLARVLGSNHVDNRARLCHDNAADALEARVGYPASTLGMADLAASDLVLVVGANPAVQQPVAFNAFVRGSDSGLVHVDPRANETTRAADAHLAPRPGTDALLLQCVAATLLADGDYDEAFVAERTTGFEAYRESLADLDVERAAAATDVPVADVRDLAARVADADGVAVVAGTGVEADDGATAEALLDLLCLTGSLGRPDAGGGFALFRGLNNEQGASDVGCRPDRLPGHQPLADADARERVADVWGVEPPAEAGLDERAALAAFGDAIRGALVVGENPAVSKRDADWTAERLDSLDALVVVDVYETDTTAHADVVLPAAVGLEKRGTVTNLDRRVQALAAVADPPGEARTDFDILCDLGERLAGDGFAYDDPGDALAELRALSPVHRDVALGERWGADGVATPDGRAAFSRADVDVDVPDDAALALVVGSRAGGFGAADASADERLHLNPADAAARGLEVGDAVCVEAADARVETTLAVSEDVRESVAYLHADVADPLVRAGAATVDVATSE